MSIPPPVSNHAHRERRRPLAVGLGLLAAVTGVASIFLALGGSLLWAGAAFLAVLPLALGAVWFAGERTQWRPPSESGIDPEARSVWQAWRRLDLQRGALLDAAVHGWRGQGAIVSFVFPAIGTVVLVDVSVSESAYALAAWGALGGTAVTWLGLRYAWRYVGYALLGRHERAPRERWWTSLLLAAGVIVLLARILWLALDNGRPAESWGVAAAVLLCSAVVVFLVSHPPSLMAKRAQKRGR